MDKQHVLSLSYGKDSLACLGAIEELGWPLDRIVHAEVWATDTIPADLPPMVEFKAKADEIIKARWGIEVEHVCAMKDGKKVTYESIFYREIKPKRERENANDARVPVAQLAMVRGSAQNKHPRQEYTDSRSSEGSGATQHSKCHHYGWPISIRRGNWCTRLKTSVFFRPQNEGREKYRSIHRDSGRRTEQVPQSDGHQAQPAGRGWMGRGILPEVVRGQ